MDGLSNCSERKLDRRDPTGFKKLPHLDDFFLWQIAMSVPECGRMLIELYTDSIAGFLVSGGFWICDLGLWSKGYRGQGMVCLED